MANNPIRTIHIVPRDPYPAPRRRRNPPRARLDSDLQPDPELAEGSASGAKIAMFALAVAMVLGAVFYGLNNSTINHAGTSPTSSTAQTRRHRRPQPLRACVT